VGEIVLNEEFFTSDNDNLRFVLAHELTHVFDALRLLVPALRNWRAFWNIFLNDGVRCEMASTVLNYQGLFVDDYGSKNELYTVQQFWPSHADKWFKATRGEVQE